MKNKDYYLTGAAIALASTAALAVYAVKKAKTGTAATGLLLAGLAGYAIGAIAATEPARTATRRLAVEDLLDDADTELMQTNISEIFGNAADRGAAPQKLRQIELDEEATIEDFI
ncbi:MAG: hypothetical protein IJW16_00135 [Clostridia bacterium]|nr:hypothetical protein [Clostridia bacterium]